MKDSQLRNESEHTREVLTRPVTFTCVVCGETVTQERFPAPPPKYCSDECRGESRRQKQRALMQSRRSKHPAGKPGRPRKNKQ